MEDLYFPKTLIEELNELGLQKPNDQTSSAWSTTWECEVWKTLAEQLLDDNEGKNAKSTMPSRKENLLGALEGIYNDIKNYDPNIAPLSNYLYEVLGRKIKYEKTKAELDKNAGGMYTSEALVRYSKNRSAYMRQYAGLPTEQQDELRSQYDKKHGMNIASMTLEDDSYREIPSEALSPGEIMEARESAEAAGDRFVQISAQIVLLLNRKIEDRENSSRKFFFPKWHTEKLKRVLGQDIVPKDERTVLTAIEENYLDFFLAKKSRTFPEIMDCPLCMENEIFPDAEAGKRLKWNSANWLPAKVPIRYLELKGSKKCANSTITRSRKDYLDFISIILERNSSSF